MKRWKQILAPWLVFLLGVLCGVGGTAIVTIKRIRGWLDAPPAEVVQRGTNLVTRRLELDDSQREALRPVMEELERELSALRVESVPRVREIVERAAREARPHLRPEQQEKLDAMLAGPRARWEQLAPSQSQDAR